jgi:uncharacterized membrane protein
MQRPTATLIQRPAAPTNSGGTEDQERGASDPRFGLTLIVLVIDGIALTLTQANIVGGVRLWFGLLFVLVVPGWALVGFLRLNWPAAEVSLTIALGLAVCLLIAQAMLWAHAWHPIREQMGIGIVALPMLGLQLARDPATRWVGQRRS